MTLQGVSVRTHASRVHRTPLFISGGPPCGGRSRARSGYLENAEVSPTRFVKLIAIVQAKSGPR